MGDTIDKRWSRSGHKPNELSSIACESIKAAAIHRSIDEDEVIRWVYCIQRLPEQFDGLGRFGRPPLTVWTSRHLLIDLYFWTVPEISIHDHAFVGAFTNLMGDSLHCLYQFEASEPASLGIGVGKLYLEKVEYLEPGSIRPFQAEPRFIHRVWHLSCPTITLAVRTKEQPYAKFQYDYLMPGLAVESRASTSIEFKRRRQFLNYLFERKHSSRRQFAEQLIRNSDAWESFHYLSDLLKYRARMEQEDGVEIEQLSNAFRETHERWIHTALRALDYSVVVRSIQWHNLSSLEQRFLLVLLCTFAEQRPIVEWIGRRYPTSSWQELIVKWLVEIVERDAVGFELDPMHIQIVMHLLSAPSDNSIIEALGQTHKVTERNRRKILEVIESIRRLPLLEPLFKLS
jgi:hypothetical protein